MKKEPVSVDKMLLFLLPPGSQKYIITKRPVERQTKIPFPFGTDRVLLVPNCQHLAPFFYIVKAFWFSGKSYKGLAVTYFLLMMFARNTRKWVSGEH
jgi:hypothetical protein